MESCNLISNFAIVLAFRFFDLKNFVESLIKLLNLWFTSKCEYSSFVIRSHAPCLDSTSSTDGQIFRKVLSSAEKNEFFLSAHNEIDTSSVKPFLPICLHAVVLLTFGHCVNCFYPLSFGLVVLHCYYLTFCFMADKCDGNATKWIRWRSCVWAIGCYQRRWTSKNTAVQTGIKTTPARFQ